jgi:hypothetical protein
MNPTLSVASRWILAGLLSLGMATPAAAGPLNLNFGCPQNCLSILNMETRIHPSWLDDENARLEGALDALRVELEVMEGTLHIEIGGQVLDESVFVGRDEGLLVYEVPVRAEDDVTIVIRASDSDTPEFNMSVDGIARR